MAENTMNALVKRINLRLTLRGQQLKRPRGQSHRCFRRSEIDPFGRSVIDPPDGRDGSKLFSVFLSSL